MPLAIKPAKAASSSNLASLNTLFARRLTTRDRLFFSEQFSLLLETGSSILPALKALEQQASNPAMKVLLNQLADDITHGKPLSRAMAQHPKFFSTTYVNLVAAAENGGFLNTVLAHLAELDEHREQLRQKIQAAAFYPAFLAIFCVAVMIFVLVAVFPKFASMFESIRDQLPWTTNILMNTSDALRHHWPWITLVTALLAIMLYAWLSSTRGRLQLDRWRLGVPGIRQLFIKIYLTESLRVLGLSLQHGVPLVEALDATREVVGNIEFQAFIEKIQKNVTEGKGLASGFEQADWTPSLVRQMLRTGEETGNMAKVMARLADYYERELTKHLTTLTKLAEPLMLLVMGVVVGVLVSSLILPIFKLSRVAH